MTTRNATRKGVLAGHLLAGVDGLAIVDDEGALDGVVEVERISEEEEEEGLVGGAEVAAVAEIAPLPPTTEAIITDGGQDHLVLRIIIGAIRTAGDLLPPGSITTIKCAGLVIGAMAGAAEEEEDEDGAMDGWTDTTITVVAEVVAMEEEGGGMVTTGMDHPHVAAEAEEEEEDGPRADGTSESETSTDATHRRLSGLLHIAEGATEAKMDPPCRPRMIEAAPRPPSARATTIPAGPRPARVATQPHLIALPGRGEGRIARPCQGPVVTPRDRRRAAVVEGTTPGQCRGAAPARRLRILSRESVAAAVVVAGVAVGGAGAPPHIPRGQRRRPSSMTRPPRTNARYSSHSL